jgi:copper chaperone
MNKSIELEVTGMTCVHCQSAVLKALKAVSGVQDVEVDLTSGKASVQGNPDPQQLLFAVQEEGYTARVLS